MFRYISAGIIIAVSIGIFFEFTRPFLDDISSIRTVSASYNGALANSAELKTSRDKLTDQYNSIKPEDLAKLDVFLPQSIDSIRLILELEKIASPYGMVLKNIQYDSSAGGTIGGVQGGGAPATVLSGSYGTFNLSFSTSTTYDNFLKFAQALESNLRLIDISSVSFSSGSSGAVSVGTNVQKNSPEIYEYDFQIKTYFLKN